MNTLTATDGELRYVHVESWAQYPDPTFSRWALDELVWIPEVGMGYLPVKGDPYGDDYFDKYAEYAQTAMGRRLTVSRIELVRRHAFGDFPTIIDIGIGCGDFIERANETWKESPVVGFDVNRAAVEWLTDRGLYRNPYESAFEVATFWDVIEHVPDVHRILTNVTGWVFAALPIVPGVGPPPPDWKHLRRDEHCFYWTRDGFIRWMGAQGFVCAEHGTPESIIGREDIHSFAFRRTE